jgi:hypothetical protein
MKLITVDKPEVTKFTIEIDEYEALLIHALIAPTTTVSNHSIVPRLNEIETDVGYTLYKQFGTLLRENNIRFSYPKI